MPMSKKNPKIRLFNTEDISVCSDEDYLTLLTVKILIILNHPKLTLEDENTRRRLWYAVLINEEEAGNYSPGILTGNSNIKPSPAHLLAVTPLPDLYLGLFKKERRAVRAGMVAWKIMNQPSSTVNEAAGHLQGKTGVSIQELNNSFTDNKHCLYLCAGIYQARDCMCLNNNGYEIECLYLVQACVCASILYNKFSNSIATANAPKSVLGSTITWLPDDQTVDKIRMILDF